MQATVSLSATDGFLVGQQVIFDEPATCVIGRNDDCNLCIPDHRDPPLISRYHCRLEINPPQIHVRDLGSHNGTRVNGKLIGQRRKKQVGEDGVTLDLQDIELNDGCLLQLPGTTFRVSISYSGVTRGLLEGVLENEPELRNIPEYEFLHELGRGGVGAVHLARHKKGGELVALKRLLLEVAPDDDARKMFRREVENTRLLRHPNIVRLLDTDCGTGPLFFTMEYCDGGSVDQLTKDRQGSLPIAEAFGIILQVLAGLEYAHAVEVPAVKLKDGTLGRGRGLVHRDLKPQNLLLCGGTDRVVKIADYGLAKAFDLAGLSGHTHTGVAAGTPHFMPRQQVLDFKYARPEADVWAAAASLYYLLTAHPPRDFPRGQDPWRIVLDTRAVPIRMRNPSIPPRIAELIDHALVDNPAITFQTAAGFRTALAAVL